MTTGPCTSTRTNLIRLPDHPVCVGIIFPQLPFQLVYTLRQSHALLCIWQQSEIHRELSGGVAPECDMQATKTGRLGWHNQCNVHAVTFCTRSAPCPMNVRIRGGRELVLDDAADVGNIKASSGDVGRDEDTIWLFLEPVECLEALPLLLLRVQDLHSCSGIRNELNVGAWLCQKQVPRQVAPRFMESSVSVTALVSYSMCISQAVRYDLLSMLSHSQLRSPYHHTFTTPSATCEDIGRQGFKMIP
jgi:hypothetical protein